MENVKKCKSFLSTLIKLASSGKQSTETAANVKDLVQNLLVRNPHETALEHAVCPCSVCESQWKDLERDLRCGQDVWILGMNAPGDLADTPLPTALRWSPEGPCQH